VEGWGKPLERLGVRTPGPSIEEGNACPLTFPPGPLHLLYSGPRATVRTRGRDRVRVRVSARVRARTRAISRARARIRARGLAIIKVRARVRDMFRFSIVLG
jgi:hypothetical protein